MRRVAVGLVLLALPSMARAAIPSHLDAIPSSVGVVERDLSAVALPERATGRARVSAGNGSISASFSLRGASAVRGVEGCGATRYEGALGAGAQAADWLVRPIDAGAESLVTFHAPEESREVVYDVALRGASGLRLVENVLELVDAGGAPQLRMRAPHVVDASGAERAATLELRGCDYDTSPIAPWGRPVVPPGHASCDVVVRWDEDPAAPTSYPVTVESTWVDGGALVSPRAAHAAVVLADGRALLTGGYEPGATSTYARSAELFDPASGTWAVTRSMRHARAHHLGVRMPSGRLAGAAVFVGGDADLVPSAESYDPARGAWTDTAPMNEARDGGRVALLSDGRILAAGGCSDYASTCTRVEASTETYDVSSDTWTPSRNAMSSARSAFTLTALPDGRAIAVGGCSEYGDAFECASDTASVDVFDPKTSTWQPTAPLSNGAEAHVATLLPSGELLVAGGAHLGEPLHTAETYDPESRAWTAVGVLAFDHAGATASLLSDGRVLIAGSLGTPRSDREGSARSELFEPRSGLWAVGPTMSHGHGEHTASALRDGSVLIAGGYQGRPGSTVVASAVGELYTPKLATARGEYAAEVEDESDAESGDLELDDVDGTEGAALGGCDIGGAPRKGTALLAIAALGLMLLARRRSGGRTLPAGSAEPAPAT